MATSVIKEKRTIGARTDKIFYAFLVAWPILHFCVFYIGINFNSFLLSFQKITLDTANGGYVKIFTFDTFKDVFALISSKIILKATGMSILSYAVTQIISLPLSLFFSYYIAKKFKFAGFFRVILFLPSILSGLVMATLYQYFIDYSVMGIVEKILGTKGLIKPMQQGEVTQYCILMFYNIWIGFGSGVLLYSNTMSGISPEIYDAAAIDGAVGFNEFRYVSLPLSFSTISVFLVTGITTIFTHQQSLYTFFGDSAPFQTLGYYVFVQTNAANGNLTHYPKLACLGLVMSAVCIPITLTLRHLLEKHGPNEN